MSASTLNGLRVIEAEVALPHSGAWRADVSIEAADALSGAVTFVLADLELRGTIVRGGAYAGAARYRIVGGAGGWRLDVPPKSYQHDVGVKLSTVLGDAARAVGEQVALDADRTVGTAFVRRAGPASRVLEQLAPGAWWLDERGVTRVGARAAGEIAGPLDVMSADPARGRAVIATETPAAFAPGRSVAVGLAAPLVAATVVHRLTAGQLRTEIWGIA